MPELPDAVACRTAVWAGKISPRELVAEALARAEALDPRLNAIVEPAFEAARARAADLVVARQPLAGVPTLLKDLFCPAAGETAYHGNRVLKGLDHRYAETGAVARRLAAAGAVSLGRSHSPEFGCGNCTAAAESALYGATRNPWDPSRTAMGSSGGAAAAVAAGIVPLAHASDGGGSIRMPASACGLVGLKPSRGRISAAPAGEVWAGGVADGVVSRTVRDTALALDVLAGPEAGDPYAAAVPPPAGGYLAAIEGDAGRLRIGLCAGLPDAAAHPDCRAAVAAAGRVLEGLGHAVEVDHPSAIDRLDYLHDYIVVIRVALAAALGAAEALIGRPWTAGDVEEGTWINYRRGLKVSARDYAAARERLHRWSRAVAAWWEGGRDVLVTPTLATPPPPVGYLVGGDDAERTARLAATIPYTPQFNVTGQPAVSLPLAWTADGVPVGVQLVAAPGREDLLLRLAAQLERAAPWRGRRPRIGAAAPV